MRPYSEIRMDLAAALVDGGGTCKMLAQRTGWSIGRTRTALDNMVRDGEVAKTHSIRVAGVKRPVPWYERAPLDDAGADEPMLSLIAAWAGQTLPQPMEAAM